MNLNLFDNDTTEPECDHLPVQERTWIGRKLKCPKCDRFIRNLDEEA